MGKKYVEVEWDYDDLSWDEYEVCVGWCKDARKLHIEQLELLTNHEYQILWLEKCWENRKRMEENKE